MIRPLRDQIIIKRTLADTKSVGGIILTQQAKDLPTQGEVVACGNGIMEGGERQPLDVQVGDTVLFPQFAGSDISVEGEVHVIMRDTDVLAVVE